MLYEGRDLLEMDAEVRAQEGIFLAFQYPVEIPGVTNAYFLRSAYNEIRKAKAMTELDPLEFLDLMEEKTKIVEWTVMMNRSVNTGFSGGEKKRNEILQMAVLEPRLAILDETDSGLDIDALKVVSNGVNALRRPDNATIVVTHYQRLLNYIVPDFVHVLAKGRIVKSGGKELALELEERATTGFPELPRERSSRSGRPRRWTLCADDAPNPRWKLTVSEFENVHKRRASRPGCANCALCACATFERLGFPTMKDEDWHFTNVAPIAEKIFGPRAKRRRSFRDVAVALLDTARTGTRWCS